MYYRRTIQSTIEKNIDRKEAVILTGMRRTGKTTLLQNVYQNIPSENKVWFDFENPLDVRIFEDIDYNDIYTRIIQQGNLSDKDRIYVFIDEVQNYPEISAIAKYLIDHYGVKFFLTGSASYYLKNLFPESLAGRKRILELYPLTFEEFLSFKGECVEQYKEIKKRKNKTILEYEKYDAYYDEFITWGGFPAVVLEEGNQEKKEILNDIFTSYFQKEILGLAEYRKNKKIRELILLLAARVGSKLDIVKISQEIGVTRSTIYSYIAFLEATYFIYLISPFSRSVDREISRAQKVYFCDNGILSILANLNQGQLFENVIYNQLKQNRKVQYYQKRNGAEIDFIIDEKYGYEVKNTASLVDVQRLVRRSGSLDLASTQVISKNYVEKMKGVIFGEFLK